MSQNTLLSFTDKSGRGRCYGGEPKKQKQNADMTVRARTRKRSDFWRLSHKARVQTKTSATRRHKSAMLLRDEHVFRGAEIRRKKTAEHSNS